MTIKKAKRGGLGKMLGSARAGNNDEQIWIYEHVWQTRKRRLRKGGGTPFAAPPPSGCRVQRSVVRARRSRFVPAREPCRLQVHSRRRRPLRTARRRPARTEDYYDTKSQVFSALIDTIDLSQLAKLDAESAREEIRDIVNDIITIKNFAMSISEQEELLEDICNDVLGYGPLEPLLARDDIADIMVNGAGQTFIEVGGKTHRIGNPLPRQRAASLDLPAHRQPGRPPRRRIEPDLRRPSCRMARASTSSPRRSPSTAPALTIRKFKKDKLTLDQLVRFGAITPEGAVLLQIIGRVRCNVVISGGTGSGKTTLLNCLTSYIDTDERVITCEDTAELQLQQPHVVRLETRPPNIEGEGEITMRDLVKNCLRMRPERIIVGEVRGPEVFDLLQAMNTGHDGSMGTHPRQHAARMPEPYGIDDRHGRLIRCRQRPCARSSPARSTSSSRQRAFAMVRAASPTSPR